MPWIHSPSAPGSGDGSASFAVVGVALGAEFVAVRPVGAAVFRCEVICGAFVVEVFHGLLLSV